MHKISQAMLRELKENIYLSIPLIASWLIFAISPFIGTAIIAHISQDALAASALIGSIWVVVTVFYYGMFNSVSILISHQLGAEHFNLIGAIIRNAFLVSIICCIPTMLIMAYSPIFLMYLIKNVTVIHLAKQYVDALLWAVPGMLALLTLENFYNGIGKTKISLWVSLCQVPIEIFFIYSFVFGKFGFSACGIAGVGYGFTASYTLTTIGLFFYLKSAKFTVPFAMFKTFSKSEYRFFKEILRVGLPIGLMYLIEVSAFATATFLIGHFSTTALAAQQITMQFLGVTVNIPYAIGQAVSIRIGINAGKNNLQGVRYASYVGMGLSFASLLMVASIYNFYPQYLLQIDLHMTDPNNINLVKMCLAFLSALSIFQLFDSIRVIEVSALRALKDTQFPMYISLITFWLLGLGCAFLLAFVWRIGAVGIWYGLTLGVAAGAIILFFRFGSTLQKADLAKIIAV